MGRTLYWLLWKPFFHFGRPLLFIVSASAFIVASYTLYQAHARAYPQTIPSTDVVDEQVRAALVSLRPTWREPYGYWVAQVEVALKDQDLPLAEAYLEAAADLVPPETLIEHAHARYPEALDTVPLIAGHEPKIETLLVYGEENLVRPDLNWAPKFLTLPPDPAQIVFLPEPTLALYMETKHSFAAWQRKAELCATSAFDGKFRSEHPLSLGCILASDVFTPYGDVRDLVVYGCAEAAAQGIGILGCDKVRQADESATWRRVILVASAIGLTITASVKAADTQVALVKASAKSGALSAPLAKALVRSADDVMATGKLTDGLKGAGDAGQILARPGKHADEVADVAKSASRQGKLGQLIDTFGEFQYIGRSMGGNASALRVIGLAEDVAELKALGRVAQAGGKRTLILHNRMGRMALRAGFVATPKFFAKVKAAREQLALAVIGLLGAALWGAIEVFVKHGARRRGAFRAVDGFVRRRMVRG